MKLKEMLDTLPQVGQLEMIGIRPAKRAPLVSVPAATITIEDGLVGDHYKGRSKKRQLTLVQAEHLAAVSSMLDGKDIDPLLTRRNLVVRGVNLLAFKNRQFRIGDEAILEMTGPCEPCSRMEENFGPGGYNAMRGHGGICARVIRGGSISIGDTVRLLETNFRKPNDQDIFPLIAADFEAAASSLPAQNIDIGRATSGAANAMLGRLHMLNGDMAAAETALNRVTGYSLVDCFHDMFSTAGENGPEMIFSIQASVNDGSGGSDNGNFGDRLNFPHAGSPFGCCGFHQPTQNLVNAYRVDGTGLPLNDNSSDDNPTASESVDPRLDWTVGRDGVPYLDWGVHDASWIRSRSWAGQYSPRKFAHLSSEASNVGWNSNHLSPVNVPIIRYADVLLMLAEIDVDNGRLDAAQDKVNMIRMRAANCAQGDGATPVPLDDPSTAHATYSVSPYPAGAFASMGAADAMEAVRLERRLELALEGHRWFDLRRYGTDYAINTMTTYFEREDPRRPFISQREPVEAKHMVYPIPTAAILQSTVDGAATLRQNPGY